MVAFGRWDACRCPQEGEREHWWPGEAVECPRANAAVMRAEALSRKPEHAGALAFNRTGDPATGEFGDAKVIRKFGDVPEDLATL